MANGIGKPQIIYHKIATSKNVGSKNVTENCLYLKTGLNIEFFSYCFLNSGNTTDFLLKFLVPAFNKITNAAEKFQRNRWSRSP